MTPAPGPLSPPASGDGLTNEASGSRGHYFTTTNTNADASTLTASTVRATSRERPSLTSASAAAAAAVNTPKTCSGCGRLLESSSPPNERAGTPSTGPSPSSIAFATNPGAVNLSSITAMLANTPAVREAMELEQQQQQQQPQPQQQPTYHIDQDGHPMCVFCFNAQQRAERFFRANATPAHTIPDPDGMNVEQSSSAGSPALPPPSSSAATTPAVDQDGDSRMSQDAAESQRAQSTDGTAVASSAEQAALPVSTPTRSVHPWRRPAPWANGERAGDSPAGSPSQSDRPPLRISVGNMGAGGDAVPAEQSSAIVLADTVVDDDFPPLPRSPHANGGAAATSPRPHLSPTRSRIGAVAGSPVPPAHVRHASFSRSLSATGGLGGAGGGAGGSGVAPVVNFPPTRGRHRASSGSGTVGATMLVGPSMPSPGPSASGAARVRRPSATRRLSRSSSSQGPTATSFADFGEVLASSSVGGSAVAEDSVRGEPIAEDPPFGPMHMTRPRLSTLEPWDIVAANAVASAAAAAGSYAPSGKMSREHARTAMTDVHRKPFVAAELLQDDASMRLLLSGGGGDGEDMGQRRRALQQRYLTWLDSKRPDPRIDVTRIRFASLGRGCLFSGSTFRGTQKSGRMSYDVTVQILNVDLAASHLCGYLNIRGLTDDWPELTTYFDAEIIGQRYGFVTGKWGATEADDLKHWSRFTPFRPIRSSLTRPGLRFNHMNKPFIFMRWKERFLVPDHRVRDISGASFAGFYYVCVELGEDGGLPRQSLTSPASPTTSPGAPPPRSVRSLLAAAGDTGEAGAASTAMEGVESAESASEVFPTPIYQGDPIAATSGRMSGFYFHEHSEPYQQLTLRHVADPSTSTYELR